MSDHDSSQETRQPAQPSRMLASMGASAVVASVALAVGIVVQSGDPATLPQAQAAPATSTTSATSTTTASSSATASTSASSTSSSTTYTADKQGYVDTKARCDDKQTLMAYGRTAKSLVAICVNPDGGLEYRGVRLADKSSLAIPATRGSDGTLVADNDGVTYSVSPTVFLVSEGDTVIYRDSWIEFQQPRFPTGTTATSAGPTTTVSTTTVTVTSSVTPTSKPGG
jgi:hypothetical protein